MPAAAETSFQKQVWLTSVGEDHEHDIEAVVRLEEPLPFFGGQVKRSSVG
jgi:hypothetical protein